MLGLTAKILNISNFPGIIADKRHDFIINLIPGSNRTWLLIRSDSYGFVNRVVARSGPHLRKGPTTWERGSHALSAEMGGKVASDFAVFIRLFDTASVSHVVPHSRLQRQWHDYFACAR